jgi:cyclophilin family peptidyl-prolyl cis-trans isomerase
MAQSGASKVYAFGMTLWMSVPAAVLATAAGFGVQLETTKGRIVIAVNREWAPRAADRFHQLVTLGYYDDSRFFRVVKGRWAQFGISGDPAIAKRWRRATIPDEDAGLRQPNVRGTVAFAFAEPGGRATQVFINLRDNRQLDAQGFVPFGRVIEGMDVADALESAYGEDAGGGIRGGKQQPIFDQGNAYLDRRFPRLDRIVHARVVASPNK